MNFDERRAYYQGAYPVTTALLKAVAYISMLIDHIAACLLKNYMSTLEDSSAYTDIYQIMRHIGRLAFVIFAFLIAEGMVYSHNRGKYLLRLAVFAVISEIPFDLALNDKIVDWSSQNVYITLFLGALCICCIQFLQKKIKNKVLLVLGTVTCAGAFGLMGYGAKCDYAEWGVILIIAFYLCRKNYRLMLGMCTIYLMPVYMIHVYISGKYYDLFTLEGFFLSPRIIKLVLFTEAYGLVSVFLIYFYRGEKGKTIPKYFYYFFYPMHLLILGMIRLFWLGIP